MDNRAGKCPMCGAAFRKKAVNQIYCSSRCGTMYRSRNGAMPTESREFWCMECYSHIVVTDRKDKRTVFCSASCEKKFWKHPHWEKSGLTKYGSEWKYIAHEKATNKV